MREQPRAGTQYLESVSALLQRVRTAHPTRGLFEAADLQWWWRTPRPTDDLEQLFWFDPLDRPDAAVIATDWGDRIALTPIVMPEASADWVAHVVERGLAHAHEAGFRTVELEVDRSDQVLRAFLIARDFAIKGDGVVETWLPADDRPEISSLPDGYRLSSRLDATGRPHHMINRNGPDVEARLRQTSLYRPDFDLFMVDRDDNDAASGLFWFDAETATGLVEPVRTEDAHQRRGLARHVLTSGIARLAAAGAERIKICFEPGNPASRNLYLSTGFQPVKRTDVFAGPTHP